MGLFRNRMLRVAFDTDSFDFRNGGYARLAGRSPELRIVQSIMP